MKIYIAANSFEKFRNMAKFLKQNNVHPRYVRIEKVRHPDDELREVEEKMALAEKAVAELSAFEEHEDYRILVEAQAKYKSILLAKDARGSDVFYSKKRDRDYNETLSEYLLKYHSKHLSQLSVRDDAHELARYVTPDGTVSFDVSPAEWIYGNSLFKLLTVPLYRQLIAFNLNERGMFLKTWSLDQQKNYWNSTLNGGLPAVKKRDVLHEGTFMLHDMFHFSFKDPVLTGTEDHKEKALYIAHRMMSEAFTLVLADMLAPQIGGFEHIEYDVTARKIFPLAKSMKLDLLSARDLCMLLHANCRYAIFGDDSEFKTLGADPLELERYKSKYSVFFSEDFAWNKRNIEDVISQVSANRSLREWAKELPEELRSFTVSDLYRSLKDEHGLVPFEALFKTFWSQLMTVAAYDKPEDNLAYTRQAMLRYAAGQARVVYQHPRARGAKEVRQKYLDFTTYAQNIVDKESLQTLYNEFSIALNTFIDSLANEGCLLPHERVVYKLHVPQFSAHFVNYDKDIVSYKPLAYQSNHILGGTIVVRESVEAVVNQLVNDDHCALYIRAVMPERSVGAAEGAQKKGSILVLSGPSGVGKDTVISAVLNQSNYRKFAAYTTRPQRPREVNNVDYRFVTKDRFFELMRDNEFLDHIVVNGHYYGTPIKDFQDVIERGHHIILSLGVKSALLLKERVDNVTTVFLLPPTGTKIIERLGRRGMSVEQIESRIKEDPTDYNYGLLCDLIVVNYENEAQTAAERILDFVTAEKKLEGEAHTKQPLWTLSAYIPTMFNLKTLLALRNTLAGSLIAIVPKRKQ